MLCHPFPTENKSAGKKAAGAQGPIVPGCSHSKTAHTTLDSVQPQNCVNISAIDSDLNLKSHLTCDDIHQRVNLNSHVHSSDIPSVSMLTYPKGSAELHKSHVSGKLTFYIIMMS